MADDIVDPFAAKSAATDAGFDIVDPFKSTMPVKQPEEAPDHGLSERQKLSPLGKALSPITSYPETYGRMRGEALEQASHGVEQALHPDSAWDVPKGLANAVLGGAGYVASPISAAYRSVIGQPVEDVTGIPREYTEFAAQLATPGLGLPALTSRVPKTVPVPPTAGGAGPFGNVTLTTGERTGELAARQAEQGALRGQAGTPAQTHAREFLETQRPEELERERSAVSRSFDPYGGQELAETPTEAAAIAQRSLQRQAARSKAGVKSLYDQAKALPGEINSNVFRNMANDIKTDLYNRPESVVIDENTPNASRMINYLNDRISKLNIRNLADPNAPYNPKQIVGVNLEGIEQWRKNLSRMRGDALASYGTNPSDSRAAQAVIDAFDKRVDQAVNSPAFRGDPRAVNYWNAARKAHSERMQTWGNDAVGRRLQAIIGDLQRDPATLNDVARSLYGESGSSSSLTVGLAKRIKKILGEQSPEWAAIKQGLFHQIVSTAEGIPERGAGTIANRINQFLNGKGSDLANAVYTPQQRQILQQYADLHRQLAIPQVAANWPNTAAGIIPHVKSVGDKILGLIGGFIGHSISPGIGSFVGYAAGEGAGRIFSRAENAANLRQIQKQMPIIRHQWQQWQQAVKKSNSVNTPQVTLAATNLLSSLSRLGVHDTALTKMLAGDTTNNQPEAAQRARGGKIKKLSDDNTPDYADEIIKEAEDFASRADGGQVNDRWSNFRRSSDIEDRREQDPDINSLLAEPTNEPAEIPEIPEKQNKLGQQLGIASIGKQKVKKFADGGAPTFDERFNAVNEPQTNTPVAAASTPDDSWKDREADEALALQTQPSASFSDYVEGAKDAAQRFGAYTGQMAKDIATLPQRLYENPELATKSVSHLLGTGGEERYQLWPERMLRSAVTLPHEAMTGDVPVYEVNPRTGEVHTSGEMILRSQDLAGMGGTGGLAGVGEEGAASALGSAPFLRPALKYEGKIFKAPVGGEHLDAIPGPLRDEFHRQALSGEDISNFNFGFMNHKGQFLNREQALDYAINEGLLSPHEARYGALTTPILRSESSEVGAPLSALEKEIGIGARAPEMKLEQAPTNLPLPYRNITGAKPELAQDVQDFLALSKHFEGKYGPQWTDKLKPEDLQEIKDSPKFTTAVDKLNGAALQGTFDKILNQPATRRNFLQNTALAARLIASSGKLGKLLENVAPKEAEWTPPKIYTRNPLWNELTKPMKAKVKKAWQDEMDEMKGQFDEEDPPEDYTSPKAYYEGLLDSIGTEHLGPEFNIPDFSKFHEYYKWPKDIQDKLAELDTSKGSEHYTTTYDAKQEFKDQLESLEKEYNGTKHWWNQYNKVIEDRNNFVRKAILLSETSKPGAAIAGLKYAEPFYSAVEKTIESAPQAKMHGVQWANWLKNQQGVKPEELEWTGIDNWLREQKGPVSKEQVLDQFNKNKVELNEVHKGDTPWEELTRGEQDRIADDFIDQYPGQHTETHPDWAAVREYYNMARRQGEYRQGTKYHSYQLSGGDNYREHLLTLPVKTETPRFWHDLTNSEKEEFAKAYNQLTPDELRTFYNNRAQIESNRAKTENTYYSSHWDEPNVLAHVRSNEREVNGKPSLHLEEIQSDWHQLGRKGGYKGNVDTSGWKAEKISEGTGKALYKVVDKNGNTLSESSLADTPEQAIKNVASYPKYAGAVPDAPFKTSWPELALKRMIRLAAEEGKSRISWTPGEAQAARYDLSKQLNKIRVVGGEDSSTRVWWPEDKYGRQIGSITTNAEGNITKANQAWGNVVGKHISDVVGKDVAERGMQTKGEKDLTGVDLTIGGEGMRGFYDNMLPKMVEKLGKKYGVNVKEGEVPKGGQEKFVYEGPEKPLHELEKIYETQSPNWTVSIQSQLRDVLSALTFGNETTLKGAIEQYGSPLLAEKLGGKLTTVRPSQKVFYFDIPPKMKEDVLTKGFPLFSETSKVGAPLSALEKTTPKKIYLRAAIKDPTTGEIFSAPIGYGHASLYGRVPDEIFMRAIDGFTTNQNKFLDRKEAIEYAKQTGLLNPRKKSKIAEEGLHSSQTKKFVEERAAGGRVVASEINHSPSEAQKSAGNYKKDHVNIHGLNLTIENAKGHNRSGIGADGQPWKVKMPSHYGYVKKSEGADGDHVDTYLGPHPKKKEVFVLNQVHDTSKDWDEHKIFIGFRDINHVLQTYEKAFSDGKALDRIGSIVPTTIDVLKHWLKYGDTKKPFTLN